MMFRSPKTNTRVVAFISSKALVVFGGLTAVAALTTDSSGRLSARLTIAPVVSAQVSAQVAAQETAEPVNRDVIWRLRREISEHSQIMPTVQTLTDLYGPRLTGSPNLRRAQDWVVRQATAWGLENAHLEAWEFGSAGWQNERAAVHLVAPVKDSLVVEVLAWTPGTNGTVTAQTVLVDLPSQRLQANLDAFFSEWHGKLRGRAVLVGQPVRQDVAFQTPAKRRDDAEMRTRYAAEAGPVTPAPTAPPPSRPAATATDRPTPLTADQAAEQLNAFLVSEGVALRINDAGRAHGQIRAFNNRTFDVARAVPTVVLRNEDYGRIARLMAKGQTVSVEATIVNQTYPDGRTQHNVIAEIPGTDKAGEVVMLGGHLDSWHAATGATDNAVGVAVMLEVARALRAIDATPRRTIRVALWSGEEQGLRGSVAYVAEHFGTADAPKPEYDRFAGYFNLDSGTGKARGMTVFGPAAAGRVLRQILEPFLQDGVMGATATRSRARGGSDHTSFNEVGLPGISVGQDPIEYDSHTWHTNLDTYERIVEADTTQAALAIATAVYHVANRDQLLPRFTKDQMPARPGR